MNIAYGYTGEKLANGFNNFNCFTPITESGKANVDVANDDFRLVADAGNHKTSDVQTDGSVNSPQPGDIFRGVIKQANGTTITHEGIVAAYDANKNIVWLIDNFISDHTIVNGKQYTTGTAEIGYHQFNLDPGATAVAGNQ